MKNVITILLCTSLFACASLSREQFRDDMETWVGASDVEVYRSFGQPTSEYVMPNANHVLVYERHLGTESRSYGAVYGGAYIAAADGTAVTRERACHIEFEFDQTTKRVAFWRASGTYCVSQD